MHTHHSHKHTHAHTCALTRCCPPPCGQQGSMLGCRGKAALVRACGSPQGSARRQPLQACFPGCLGAWVTGARLLPAEGAQGTAGHRLPPGRWHGAQLTLPRLTPAPPCREVPCSFGLLGHCVGEPQPALASISPHGLQCCGPITQGPWGPGEPGRAGQGRPQKPKTLSTM